MAEIRVTRRAQEQINALDDAGARAVDWAIQGIGERTSEPIKLPGAPPGTTYLALPARNATAGPVIIYRPLLPDEGDGWLILSLLSREEYRNIRQAEELVATSPAAREIVDAAVAGTVATVKVEAHFGSVSTTSPPPGAAPTTSSNEPG
jgi:hypothetical protein